MSLQQHERLLWGIAFRMLGSATEADEVVQDCFLRALERQPEERDGLRPWLVRVTTNLCRDRLRGRKRSATWLPDFVDEAPDPEERIVLRESAHAAYLLALEALTPIQRAVLLLRDVFELSAAEVAEAVDSKPGAVRAAHLRARRAMEGWSSPADGSEHLQVASAFMAALAQDDLATARRLLADDAVLISDGGGRYAAAYRPVVGPDKVWAFLTWLRDRAVPQDRFHFASHAGRPGMVYERGAPKGRESPRSATLFVVRGGRIEQVLSQVVPEKLRL